MAESFENTVSRYCALFGVSPGFSEEELTAAYRTLAKLNHPDINEDPSSGMRMIIINEGYRFLKDERTRITAELFQKNKIDDPAYTIYRSSFDLMSAAFENYYGEKNKSLESDLSALRSSLAFAKAGFSRLITEFPASNWTSDAIDRIFSINTWLEEK